jgi:hypothetical protein
MQLLLPSDEKIQFNGAAPMPILAALRRCRS